MSLRTTECGLIVFLRNPLPGQVKSRIAATVGPEQALTIYTELVRLTLNLVADLPVAVYLYFEGGIPDDIEKITSLSAHHQSRGDLGQKMISAFREVLMHHSKVMIIGSDCPLISRQLILAAFHHLDQTDCVIGPAFDGGYYLLACKALWPPLFSDINWGSSSVLMQTKRMIQKLNLSWYELPVLADIDTAEDWATYLHQMSNKKPPV